MCFLLERDGTEREGTPGIGRIAVGWQGSTPVYIFLDNHQDQLGQITDCTFVLVKFQYIRTWKNCQKNDRAGKGLRECSVLATLHAGKKAFFY